MQNLYPPSWVEASLPDVVYFQEGPGLRKFQFREEGVPFLNIQTLSNERVDKTKCKFLDPEEVQSKYSHFLLDTNDIICSSSGTLGKTAIIREDDKPLMLNTSVIRFRPHAPDLFLRSYLHIFLKSQNFLRQARSASSGSAQVNFGPTHLVKFTIPVPPLNEQHRIVAKIEELFSELDKGIENLKTAQAQLKVYRQALLKHAFEGKLTAQWRAANPDKLEPAAALRARIQTEREQRYRQQLQQWEATGGSLAQRAGKPKAPKPLPPLTAEELAEMPELPEGWGWFKVAHICDVVRGGSPRPAGDPKFYGGSIPFLKVADITTTSTPYLNTYTYTITEAGLSKTRQIEPNTLLLSNSGATLGVPKICLIAATMNDGVAAFLGLSHEVLLYHYYFWQSKTKQLRNIDQGAAQPNLNTDLIKETFIPICSQAEQIAVAQRLEEVLSEADQLDRTLTTSLQQSEALRQSILKKAFAGTLVAQDANDEPAAALLARIRAGKIQSAGKPNKSLSRSKRNE